ncbi:MAG: amidohydrolase family protein, partial [Anaerolineales bacterium]|nr:amidohydrolase family protein [Anaerolineales bacterium]
EAWYAQVVEEIIEPERPIIDPHHHLWFGWGKRFSDYLLGDLWGDTESGHKIEKTVFIECGASYRETGPDHLKPVGETEFVADIAAQSASADSTKAVIAGIISHADLTLGDTLGEVLDAHEVAGKGLFRGIRHAGAHHPHPEEAFIPGRYAPGLFLDEAFQAGVQRLGQRGYTYESWHYHFQLRDFYVLAKAAPETTIILDHFGIPLGTKSYRNQREAIFQQWQADITTLAECPNVFAKLGGLAMPDNGFGWHKADKPATSDELVAAQKQYYLYTIKCFGVNRCLFESNFPVDKLSISYAVLWNAFKKMVVDFSEDEKHALFYGTAAKVYRL